MTELTILKGLHQFKGHPGQFWSAFLTFATHQVGAVGYALLGKKTQGWKPVCQSSNGSESLLAEAVLGTLQTFADRCLSNGSGSLEHPANPAYQLLALKLEQGSGKPGYAAVFVVPQQDQALLDEKLARLRLLADCPAVYQRYRSSQQNEHKLNFFADLLALLQELNSTSEFLAAAMLLVNETAASHHCSRVSLGWLEKGYIKLQAISHMESFEGKMEIVTQLEAAMEEAIDQDEEIMIPADTTAGPVAHDHQIYAKQQQSEHLVSLPLRANGQTHGVLSFERREQAFSPEELLGLRILADQVTARLAELKRNSRWVGARVKDRLQQKTDKLLGPEYSLAKLTGLLIALLLFCSVVVKTSYRIEAPFILRSEDVRQVSAPVDGYIEGVHIEIGEQIERGQLLLTLDNRDLYLEEGAALANRLRYLREAEKARARGSLIDMKIAQAQAQQAQAQLEMIRHRLGQMEIRSTMNGIVVEGDLEELHGAPVNKGDILFKIARHEKLFAEFKIAEQDIHEAVPGQIAELAFIGRPDLKFPLKLEQIDPVALADDSGNVFLATGKSREEPQAWWRPGMSGIAKIDVGQRRILWILSHRTIDFLRMLIWW